MFSIKTSNSKKRYERSSFPHNCSSLSSILLSYIISIITLTVYLTLFHILNLISNLMLKHHLHYSLFVLRNSDFTQRLKSSLSLVKSFLRNIIKITAIPFAVPTTRIISKYSFRPDYIEFDESTFESIKQRFDKIDYNILHNYLIIGRRKRLILFNKIILFTWLKRY